MADIHPLAPELLFKRCDPEQFTFTTTDSLEDMGEILGQARAFDAIKFGTGIQRDGYNIFVLGSAGTGKHSLVRQFLESRAQHEAVPSDLCYVNNFEKPHRPNAILLPPGRGIKFRQDMHLLIEELRVAIPAAFESEEYRNKIEAIQEAFGELQNNAFGKLGSEAEKQNIALLKTPTGFTFAPMKNGEVIQPEEYEKLPEEEKSRIEELINSLEEQLQKIIRQVPQWRKDKREKVKHLNREITLLAVGNLISEVRINYVDLPEILHYLDTVQQDIIDNADEFRKQEEPSSGAELSIVEAPFKRYQVNLLVDHRPSRGAPIIYEDHPMYSNLVGRVEHVSHMGALVTDFTLIKPGSLHLANGGYLLLDIVKVLSQPFGWEGLKRALTSHEVRIESLGQMLSLISTVSLEPEPVPLNVKIILFGERIFYYLLYEYDPEFSALFKVAADFEDSMDRTPDTNKLYARLIGTLARKQKLLPFERHAVARVIEHSARIVGDAEKLSTHMQSIMALLSEADYWAQHSGKTSVSTLEVQKAIDTRIHRADRLKQRTQEQILRGTVLIDTQGSVVGQVNGLAVIDMGNYAFSMPARITATTRLGDGELINIEREVELSGASHSKGVLILSSFLAQRYAKSSLLSLSASITFEQSYGRIDGDSASVAELCALLSSLSGIPILQSLAITGSVNQLGLVQAIGGVNEKIEGFFDICKARKLTGTQGVLIPATNVTHLMLRQDVVDAAKAGQFHIYPIESVDQALELLTGMPIGEPDAIGNLPENSVNYQVMAKLFELTAIRQSYANQPKDNKSSKRKHR